MIHRIAPRLGRHTGPSGAGSSTTRSRAASLYRCGLPLSCPALRLRNLLGSHLFGNGFSVICIFLLVIPTGTRRRKIQPHVRFHIVLGYPFALVVREAKVELGGSVSLFGGF